MESGKHLSDAAASGIAPNHDVAQTKLLSETFNVLDVVLDQIGALGIPGGVAMAAHIHGQHVISRCKVRRDVVEGMRDPSDAMQHDQRRLVRGAPLEIVNAQTIHVDESVIRLWGLE